MVIEALNKENPFAGLGNIVSGERFIGRDYLIKNIRDKVLSNVYSSNLSIIGLPRVGKTSLVLNALKDASEQKQLNRFIFYIDIGEYTDSEPNEIFHRMLSIVFEEAENIPCLEELEKIYSDFLNPANNTFKCSRLIDLFYKTSRDYGLHYIYIFDEFDAIITSFSEANFMKLRLLISNKIKYNITLLTISRNDLCDLEPQSDSSKISGNCTTMTVGLFDEDDMSHYWRRVENYYINISPEYKKNIEKYVGAHPYLLDVINDQYYNLIKYNTQKDKIQTELNCILSKNFESMLQMLDKNISTKDKRTSLRSKIIQFVIGPQYDLRSIDIEKLKNFQVVKQCEQSKYSGFSEYFTDFLQLKQLEVPVWPLFSEYEKNVRRIISYHYQRDLEWIKKHPYPKFIKGLEEMRSKAKSQFGSLASDDLIDYVYTKDYFGCFIEPQWTFFSTVFLGKDKNTWKTIFDNLAKVRNPLAHHNRNFVSQSEINSAKTYCEQIIKMIVVFLENK